MVVTKTYSYRSADKVTLYCSQAQSGGNVRITSRCCMGYRCRGTCHGVPVHRLCTRHIAGLSPSSTNCFDCSDKHRLTLRIWHAFLQLYIMIFMCHKQIFQLWRHTITAAVHFIAKGRHFVQEYTMKQSMPSWMIFLVNETFLVLLTRNLS